MNVLTPPYIVPGYDPTPEGPRSEDEREQMRIAMKQQRMLQAGMESFLAKAAISGVAGFGLGAFFSLMSASFAMEDPLRNPQYNNINNWAKTKEVFKDMGRGMWRSGKGFGAVGALYAGTEAIIEGYRAKNDIYNAISAGFLSGAILARNSGPRAMVLGGGGFAIFSAAIDLYLRRDTEDLDA